MSLNTPTYIMWVHKHAHTHTLQEQQMLLMALTFAYGPLWRPCAWPLPSECHGASEYSLFGLDTGPKTHRLLQSFSISVIVFQDLHLDNWDRLTGLKAVVLFHYKTVSLFKNKKNITQKLYNILAAVKLIQSIFFHKIMDDASVDSQNSLLE